MRVALGTTVLERGKVSGGIDGIGNYSRELLSRLQQLPDFALEPYMYAGVGASEASHLPMRVGGFKKQALFSLLTGLPFPIASRSFSGKFDLLHATDHLIPCVRNIPVVATLMDAIPLSHPEWLSYRYKPLSRVRLAMWKRSAQWATHFLTISGHSKRELVKWFSIPDDRISVVPLGVDQRWFIQPSVTEVEQVRSRYSLPARFFIFVGTLQPRKNVARLIEAHKALPPHIRRNVPLVIVGRPGWGCEREISMLAEGRADSLRWLRYVPDGDIVPLVSQACALVFPSLHEGFGLPVLEAFAAGTPVITSNSTSLPEVAGSAAMLIDPLEVRDIAEAMHAVSSDTGLAETLSRQGRDRARAFSWERTSELTVGVYRRVLKEG